MSDGAIGALAAAAALAQGVLGESGGLASRLHAALGQELARARADVAFATSAAPAMGIARRAADERPGAFGPEAASVRARGAEGAVDGRTRAHAEAFARSHRVAGRADDDRDGRDGVDDRDGPDERQRAISATDLDAIERALRTAQDAVDAAGVTGRLAALVLPGEALRGAPSDRWHDARACDLLILCAAFDGELGAGRRVWGYGYLDARACAALDAFWAHEVDEGSAASSSAVWDVHAVEPRLDGHARVVCLYGRGRCEGALLPYAVALDRTMPDRWFVELHEAPTWS